MSRASGRSHTVATPRLGGLAIILGFGFPLLLLAANERAAELVTKNLTYLFAVLASGSLVVGLGVYDDLIGTNAQQKFAVQFAAAFILVAFGLQFDFISVAGTVFNLGLLGAVASVFWIVGVMNAMNFIDGMDSLATVVALTIAAAFSVIAILRYDAFSLVIMTALTGSLIGFYPWNKPPAKIFMGDTGALFIGLLLAAGSIARPSKSPTALIIGGPMLALALPVIDTLIVMKQRFGGTADPARGASLARLHRRSPPHSSHSRGALRQPRQGHPRHLDRDAAVRRGRGHDRHRLRRAISATSPRSWRCSRFSCCATFRDGRCNATADTARLLRFRRSGALGSR